MTESMMRQLWLHEQTPAVAADDLRVASHARAMPWTALSAKPPLQAGAVHPELGARDSVVLMLHVAAEIEHALMVQYLFAAYSIRDALPIPGSPDGSTTTKWRDLILQTAREEMGHFLTVQNALTLLGGATHLGRDSFPHRSRFYPFEFVLERLTVESLSRYIAAEMPQEALIPASILSPVQLAAIRAATGGAVNRVGLLFAAIDGAIGELDNRDLWPQHQPWQADGLSWNASFIRPADLPSPPNAARGVVASQMLTKADLLKVLGFVASQGESPDQMFLDSHFARFAQIYRELDRALQHDPTFSPTYPVLRNPNTTVPPDPQDILTPEEQARERVLASGRISDAKSSLWAHLFNLRYRLILTALHHSILLGPTTEPEGTPPLRLVRDTLVRWAFDEMVYGTGTIREMALLLVSLPSGIDEETAGPTFELPYTLELPACGPARWQLYHDLFDTSAELVNRLKSMTPTAPELVLLDGIVQRDSGPPTPSRRTFLELVKDLDV